jgi:ribosome-associated protein
MNKFTTPPDEQDTDLTPSKSQLKRDMKELQELGKKLVAAPDNILKNISIDENLTNAIILCRRLSNNGSKRRQFQYIGKLLSQIETHEIRQVLDSYSQQQHNINKAFHELEVWRNKLIQDGDTALDDLLNKHKNLDRQHLRQLIRNAQKEESQQKPPASSRAIFRYLKDNIK